VGGRPGRLHLVYEPRAVAPYPSAADALWLAAYPAACIGTIALMCTRLRASFRATLWVDAAGGATAVGAVVAALLLTPVVEGRAGTPRRSPRTSPIRSPTSSCSRS
jgi:hypothetical protein